MGRWLDKLVDLLQLARIEFILAATADSWLMIALAYHVEPGAHRNPVFDQLSPPLVYLFGALIAGGLSTYGLALNDLLDVRRDRAFSPRRPLPTGAISHTAALCLTVLGLLGAMAAALALGRGSALLCGVTAAMILFYNTTARFFPALGLISFAMIRVLAMFIPNPNLGFAWPIWLNFTYVVCTATMVYALVGKRPRLLGPHYPSVCAWWAFWTLALIGWMSWRDTLFVESAPSIWLGPLAAIGAFIILAAWRLPRVIQAARQQAHVNWPTTGRIATLRTTSLRSPHRADFLRSRRAAGHELTRLAGPWLILLNAGWLLAAGARFAGFAVLGLFALTLGLLGAIQWHQQRRDHPTAYRIQPFESGAINS